MGGFLVCRRRRHRAPCNGLTEGAVKGPKRASKRARGRVAYKGLGGAGAVRTNGGSVGYPGGALVLSHTARSEELLPIHINNQRHYASCR
jgi:hypothetical protein